MSALYLIVGVDQEGDACWDLKSDLGKAKQTARDMSECAFDSCVKLYRVDASPNVGDDPATKEIKYV